jgi:integrase
MARPKGSIRELRTGVWEVRVTSYDRLGRRKPISRTVHGDEEAAEAKRRRLLVEVEDGRHQGDPTRTVGELLDRHLEQCREMGRRQRTLDGYEALVRLHIKPALGHKKVTKLTVEDVDDFYSEMRRGSAKGSIPQAHAVLHKALRLAEKWQWIERGTNPASYAEPGPPPEPEIDPPPLVEVVKLLNEAGKVNPAFGMFLFLKAVTGSRRGEMCALRRDDLELAAGAVTFDWVIEESSTGARLRRRGKTKRSTRTISIGPATVALLEEHLARLAARAEASVTNLVENHYLFSNAVDGSEFWRPDWATDWFGTIRDNLEYGWRMHDLRHFETTQLLHAGFDIRMVSGRGGWANATMALDRYGHFMPASDQAAAEFMERTLMPGSAR